MRRADSSQGFENPKLAFVFPGQGSQYAGMGKLLAAEYPEARQVFENADAALGFSLSELCFNGPEEDLKKTENTQPALLAVSIAAYRALQRFGYSPDIVAGHSLGEYSALVAAESLDFGDALQFVRKRGRYMQEAVPEGVGAMAALLKLPRVSSTRSCKTQLRAKSLPPRTSTHPTRWSSPVTPEPSRVRWNWPRLPERGAPFSCPSAHPFIALSCVRLRKNYERICTPPPSKILRFRWSTTGKPGKSLLLRRQDRDCMSRFRILCAGQIASATWLPRESKLSSK